MVEDINFIKTDKVGDNLKRIQEEYPNSIIDVNSHSERNIYIGSERVTDNYNLGVDDSCITNNVGGMTSGINASELKGKSISEILDTILFASNNNITIKGVQVVDKIENLTDNTLVEVYQGMVVSVVEDNSLYILLSDSDSDREWKKVGSDIDVDIDEIKKSAKQLSEPITVAGLSENLGANISNGKTYTNIEEILRDLLCNEIYPNVSLTTTNPTINFGGLMGVNESDYESIMEVGSVLSLNAVTLDSASITSCSRMGIGFSYGYSVSVGDDSIKDDGNPPAIYGTSSLVGSYSLEETYSPSSIGIERSVNSSVNYEDVKFSESSVNIGLGSNIITITAQSPSGTYLHPEYPEYYIVSNLGNTSDDKKLSKSPEVSGTLSAIESSVSISVTGVYPVYVNISSGSFVDEPIKMSLTTSNIFEFSVPSEVASEKHFSFYYPSGRVVESFEIKDLSGNYVAYSATYENVLVETPSQSVGGEEISYMRLSTTGNLKGKGTYKITLSKGLDIK